jgi:2-polyprenyl-6-methoxyphenol hydroxylase-like FAD-dependent oxidoreductase
MAALAALAEGSAVTLFEKSTFPRHKVCGEFLSPEIATVLRSLDLWPAFAAARPVPIERAILHLGGATKRFPLPEPAYGLSRFALDRLLLDQAVRRGADLRTELRKSPGPLPGAAVIAHGRQTPARARDRLFGFKAHFRGQADASVEMFFFEGCYVGISPVEDAVNVCGLAPEASLRACGFEPEALFPPPLAGRLRNLERAFDWLMTGPLVFRDEFSNHAGVYLAGDAMGFVDPFTGSGILSAMLTGRLAGQAASRGLPIDQYNAQCRRVLRRQYSVASLLRRVLGAGLAESLARWVPGRVLYRLTRPSI